jgi:cysteine sulfinate desulfinase/cysteine desulfurase-like protein
MDMTPHFPIYMDYGATTPVDPRVVDAMIPWLREHFGNPASPGAGRPRRRSRRRAPMWPS